MKYAWHGSAAFDDFIESQLKELAEDTAVALGDNLDALILAGGYGRGEGGIVVLNGCERPYNDLDLIPVLKSQDQKAESLLLPISRKYAGRLGIHVDFSRPLTRAAIGRLPHKLMWQDLLHGHIVISGDQEILIKHMPSLMRETLPMIEASHLLLNRGAGLIWSIGILEGYIENSESDFVRRNYFKAALALGDALLIAHGRHQTAYRGRDRLLEKLADEVSFPYRQELLPLYNRSLVFKFSPDQESGFKADLSLIRSLAEMFVAVFLYIEGRRMHKSFICAAEYCASDVVREASEHALKKLPRNLYYNLKSGRLSLLYPRDRLYRLMPALLSSSSKESGWQHRCHAFLSTWEKFN